MDQDLDRHRPALRRAALLAVPAAFLGAFYVYPLTSIVSRGLRPAGRWDLGGVADVVTDPALRHVAWFTLWQAAVSTVLTLLVALPGAHVLARFRFPGRRVVRALIVVPFVLPTVVVGSAFLSLLGPRSPLGFNLAGTVPAILIAHVFFNYAVVVRVVGGLWASLDPRQEEAARVLGASRWRAFREVTLPALRPVIGAAAVIVFLFTFTSFGVIQILGGSRLRTLEVEIYTRTAVLLDLRTAAVLSIVQLGAVSALLGLYQRAQRGAAVAQRLRIDAARRPHGAGERVWVGGNLAVTGLLLGVPLAVLAERSVSTTSGLGLAHWRSLGSSPPGSTLFVAPVDAITNSVIFALAATVLAVVVGGLAAAGVAHGGGRVARLIDGLLTLPLGTSAVTIGFGFVIALDRPPLDLRGTAALVPIAQALVAVPFVVRTVLPVLRSIDDRLREAASVLGASPRRVWREVDLPIVLRALTAAAGFAFAISLGEFGATTFIARADTPTLPIAIARALSQPGSGSFGQAMAMSTVLMAVTALAVLAIERVQIARIGDL